MKNNRIWFPAGPDASKDWVTETAFEYSDLMEKERNK